MLECLVDGVRYALPDTLPPPARDELRPMLRPRITRKPSPRDRRWFSRRDCADLDQLIGVE
jgi:hypothetical protein